jgi:hypothetical protein
MYYVEPPPPKNNINLGDPLVICDKKWKFQ